MPRVKRKSKPRQVKPLPCPKTAKHLSQPRKAFSNTFRERRQAPELGAEVAVASMDPGASPHRPTHTHPVRRRRERGFARRGLLGSQRACVGGTELRLHAEAFDPPRFLGQGVGRGADAELALAEFEFGGALGQVRPSRLHAAI
jgi:hypothetical protein